MVAQAISKGPKELFTYNDHHFFLKIAMLFFKAKTAFMKGEPYENQQFEIPQENRQKQKKGKNTGDANKVNLRLHERRLVKQGKI